jgi:alpha-tubulin suppressor-like RCC1 family protein
LEQTIDLCQFFESECRTIKEIHLVDENLVSISEKQKLLERVYPELAYTGLEFSGYKFFTNSHSKEKIKFWKSLSKILSQKKEKSTSQIDRLFKTGIKSKELRLVLLGKGGELIVVPPKLKFSEVISNISRLPLLSLSKDLQENYSKIKKSGELLLDYWEPDTRAPALSAKLLASQTVRLQLYTDYDTYQRPKNSGLILIPEEGTEIFLISLDRLLEEKENTTEPQIEITPEPIQTAPSEDEEDLPTIDPTEIAEITPTNKVSPTATSKAVITPTTIAQPTATANTAVTPTIKVPPTATAKVVITTIPKVTVSISPTNLAPNTATPLPASPTATATATVSNQESACFTTTPEWRTRYKSYFPDSGESFCRIEHQSRDCRNGVWSKWSGTFSATSCASSTNASCSSSCFNEFNKESRNCVEYRTMYKEASVQRGNWCRSEQQARGCSNGTFSPDPWTITYSPYRSTTPFTNNSCTLQIPPADLNFVNSADKCTDIGSEEFRTRYRSRLGTGPEGECHIETQSRKCTEGLWSKWTGTYQETLCSPPSNPNQCSNLCYKDSGPYRYACEETRTRYIQPLVDSGRSCLPQTQIRGCQLGVYTNWTTRSNNLLFGPAPIYETCAFAPTVSFNTSNNIISEDQLNNHSIVVELSMPVNTNIVVSYAFNSDVSTVSGLKDGYLEIPAGSTFAAIPINLTDNTFVNSGQIIQVSLLATNAAQVSIGDVATHRLKIKDNEGGSPSFKFIASGNNHSCGILSSGTLKCWGSNEFGQLGDGTTENRSSPVTIDPGTSYVKVAAGAFHTCGITSLSNLKCWGRNNYGQIGDKTTTTKLTPVTIDGTIKYSTINTLSNFNCGITSTGALKCWGHNSEGQLGDATRTNKLAPTRIDSTLLYAHISTGHVHSCGLTTDKRLRCWGSNIDRQFGDGTTTSSLAPKTIVTNSTSLGIIADESSTCLLSSQAALTCSGKSPGFTNIYLDTGYTYLDSSFTYKAIDFSRALRCGIASDSSLRCKGEADIVHLGKPSENWVYPALKDLKDDLIIEAGPYAMIAIGSKHSCALTSSGEVKCWGDNSFGQLGIGNYPNDTGQKSFQRWPSPILD